MLVYMKMDMNMNMNMYACMFVYQYTYIYNIYTHISVYKQVCRCKNANLRI